MKLRYSCQIAQRSMMICLWPMHFQTPVNCFFFSAVKECTFNRVNGMDCHSYSLYAF
jgi:hypothetical protein